MKRKSGLILLLGFVFLFFGCASTDMSYLANPEIQLSKYSKIMIFAPFQDIGWRKAVENDFVDSFAKNGKIAVSSLNVINPLKKYSDEEFASIIASAGIDAVLSIVITDAYSDQSYIPPSSTTTGSAHLSGNTIYGQSRTTTSGGYYVSKPRVKFEINLYDARSGVLAWKATAFTRGNAFANVDTLFKSVAEKASLEYSMQP